MFYLVPFILTFLSNGTFVFLIASYGFVHADLTHTYNMSKIQFGVVYGINAVGTVVGTILYFLYSSVIKGKIVTFYTWGCSAMTLIYLSIVLCSLVFDHPHKSILMILMFLSGVIRCIYFPCTVIITKIHEDKVLKKIDAGYDKLLKSIWSIGFDLGTITGFFLFNWLYYTHGWKWQYLIILGASLHVIINAISYITLMPYIEQQNGEWGTLSIKQNSQPIQKRQVTISQLFGIIKEHTSSQLFIINNAILEGIHINMVFVLPPYFYSIGFKGHEGYFVAIYSIFITIGSTVLGFIDFAFQKFYSWYQRRKIQQNQYKNTNLITNQHENNQQINSSSVLKAGEDREIFLVVSSIFLFIFFIMELVMMFTALRIHIGQYIRLSDSQITSNMIKICTSGFFFGGPIKSYLSYRVLVTMRQLDQFHEQKQISIKNQQQQSLLNDNYKYQQSSLVKKEQNLWSRIMNHKVELGSSFVAVSRIIVYGLTIVFYLISFFLIQKHVTHLFIFLSFMGFLGVIFDIVQDVYFFKRIKQRKLKMMNKKQLKQN